MTEPTDRSLPVTGLAFTALMVAAGIVVAFLLRAYPGLGDKLPGMVWLLIVAFPFDLAVNALAARGSVGPLTMNWRVGGFIAGALLQIVLSGYVLR